MERPSSQLENVRPSGLKPPSRLPAMSMSNATERTLSETTQSDLNSKSAGPGSMMPPPMTVSSKHKMSGLPEPPTKRKTLAERAGEPLNPLRSHMPQPARPTVSRSDSTVAQTGSRPPSNSIANGTYRSTSNASTASSTGSVIRPSSRQNNARLFGTRPPSVADSRTPVVVAEEETEQGGMGKRKGTPILSFHNTLNGIPLRKTRARPDLRGNNHQQQRQPSADVSSRSQHSGSYSCNTSSSSSSNGEVRNGSYGDVGGGTFGREVLHGNGTRDTSQETSSTRNVSLNTALASLSLAEKDENPHRRSSSKKHQPSLSPVKEMSPSKIPKFSCTPSLRHAASSQAILTPSPLKHKASLNGLRTPVTGAKRRLAGVDEIPVFLTKEKLTPITAWDTKGRLEDMEQLYFNLRSQFASAADSKNLLEGSMEVYKSRVQELLVQNRELSTTNKNLSSDLDRARNDLHATTTDLSQARRDHERNVIDAERKYERELNDLSSKQVKECQQLERELEKIREQGERQFAEAKRDWEKAKDDETAEMTTQHWEEIEEMRTTHLQEVLKLQTQLSELRKAGESRASESATEVQALRDSIVGLQTQLDAAKTTMTALRSQIAAAEARSAALEQEKTALTSKAHFLEGNQEAQSLEFTSMSDKLQEAINTRDETLEQLRKEEMRRRKLNATILELRGNIRVFVRTRPLLAGEEEAAKVEYPDINDLDGGKEMVVYAPTRLSATGKELNDKHPYSFDRVFGPATANHRVFEDCQELIQSVVDGYNVSILSYGQTGSGKTFGMSGPDGIVPCSISLLLGEMQRLREKGWEYAIEASFVEVYNETINDLLGDAKTWDDGDGDLGASVKGKKKEKHEIHHDAATGKTTITNLSSISLWPPPENDGAWPPPDASAGQGPAYTEKAVSNLLDTAAKNRRVAATKSNERSSRSHSIFMLTLRGHCAATGDTSEGILNLVDLAGSERLKQSGAEGNRMKETQAINKSLSSLGDVIAALGSKKGDESHIPYRNSKLTYLLQSSLGGTAGGKSSRTLMLLHLSPLQAHWQESRSSLLFGSKVHGTCIGTARRK